MSVCFNRERASVRDLKRAIDSTGFRAQRRRSSAKAPGSPVGQLETPAEAPGFLREALQRARREQLPVVLDFHATWCGPCRKYESVTFAETSVIDALKATVFVKIDVDEYPDLARHFAVHSVPHLMLADSEGRVRDHIRRYLPANAFRQRLRVIVP